MGKTLPSKETNSIIEINGISLSFIILIVGSFFILTSCSSSKNVNCDAYGKIPYEDTIIISTPPINSLFST